MAQQYSVTIDIRATGDAVLAKVNAGIKKIETALGQIGPKSQNAFSKIQQSGTKAARSVAAAFIKTGRKIEGSFGRAATKLQGQLGKLSNGLAAIGGGIALKGLVDAGVENKRLEASLKLATKTADEYQKVLGIANDAATKFGIGTTESAQALKSLYSVMKPLGIETDTIATLFNGVNNAALKAGRGLDAVDGVMVQLIQGMATGALRTQDLRVVLNYIPDAMQALQKATGKTAAEIFEMASKSELTTDIIVKMGEELGKLKAPPPDSFKVLTAELSNLAGELGLAIVPIIAPLVAGLNGIVQAFNRLPGPVKTVAGAFILFAGAFVIIAPLLAGFVGALAAIGPAFTAIGASISAFMGLLGSLGPALAGITAILAGPVGWIAILVAVGVAVWAFRDQIGQAFQAIAGIYQQGIDGFKSIYVDPVIAAYETIVKAFQSIGPKIADALSKPFQVAVQAIKGVMNGLLGMFEAAINNMVRAINHLIRQANRALAALRLPNIPTLSPVSIPRLAKGGYVDGPTVAEIGEGGEPEYVIPASKMQQAMERYSAGARGNSVIPNSANVNVNYSGSTVSMGGIDYIQKSDVPGLVNQAVSSTLKTLRRSSNSRLYAGLA